MEKVIGIHTFLLTFEGVDLSNIFSGIGFGRYENLNLLFVTNASFTKLWDNPESSNVRCRQEIEITREEIYSTHTTKKAGYVVERDRPRYI